MASLLSASMTTETFGLPPDFVPRRWQNEAYAEFRKLNRITNSGYFSFLLSAGVGSGKTIWSGMMISYMLNRGDIDRVVFVCPNRLIRKRVIGEMRTLNIHLVKWDRNKHRDGLPDGINGVVMTYQKLLQPEDLKVHSQLCEQHSTMVVFDEIHHLGQNLSWGQAAEAAFLQKAKCVLGLSGTPYRTDNRRIPFVEYEELSDEGKNSIRRFKANYTYTLGRAVNDGVCKTPVFHWLDGNVRVKLPDGSKAVYTFEDDIPLPLANRRLHGAVRHGSNSRALALSFVLEDCRRKGLKLIIFVGGDSTRKDAGGVKDATEFLPAELRSLGIKSHEMVTVAGVDSLSAEKIDAFGKSRAWILITVTMVSEGVDIPELSAGLFLTNITARATTIQRIGRSIRGQGEAHFYMFADPRNRETAELIMTEIGHEVDLGKDPKPDSPEGYIPAKKADGEPVADGIDCREGGVTVNGTHFSEAVRRKYEKVVQDYRWPSGTAFMSVILPLIVEGKFGPVDNHSGVDPQ